MPGFVLYGVKVLKIFCIVKNQGTSRDYAYWTVDSVHYIFGLFRIQIALHILSPESTVQYLQFKHLGNKSPRELKKTKQFYVIFLLNHLKELVNNFIFLNIVAHFFAQLSFRPGSWIRICIAMKRGIRISVTNADPKYHILPSSV